MATAALAYDAGFTIFWAVYQSVFLVAIHPFVLGPFPGFRGYVAFIARRQSVVFNKSIQCPGRNAAVDSCLSIVSAMDS
jgi:hypothetical protein